MATRFFICALHRGFRAGLVGKPDFGFSACIDHSHLGLNFGHATFRNVDIRFVPCRPRRRASVPGIVISLAEKFGFCRFLGHERMVPAKPLKSETGRETALSARTNAKNARRG